MWYSQNNKPPLVSAATPHTSAVSSPPHTQQAVTTKPTTMAAAPSPKQHQITTINNISQSTIGAKGATVAPVSHSTTNASSSPSGIAPQVKAVNEQQQPLSALPIRLINGTAGINSTAGAVLY